MPRTAEGAGLTAQHRQAQLQIRARALQDFIRIWPLWNGDRSSFSTLIEASVPLAQFHYRLSGDLATAYYREHRKLERVGGSPTPRTGTLNTEALTVSLGVTGEKMTQKAIVAGQSPQAAMQNALVRTSGALSRHVLTGGRDAIVLSVAADRETRGWGRVTAGEPCAFCALLAGRGAVFSEDTADFEAHDHCACGAEALYEDSELPGRASEFRDLYNRATKEARESGDLERGTSNDLLNAFRRAYSTGV